VRLQFDPREQWPACQNRHAGTGLTGISSKPERSDAKLPYAANHDEVNGSRAALLSCWSVRLFPLGESAMNAQDIISTVSEKTGLDQAATERTAGIIFSVFQHEAEGTGVADLFTKIPGAAALAQQYDVMANVNAGGGLLGSLESALGGALGEKAGALINGLSQLKSSGLSLDQIQQAGTALIEEAQAAAGPDVTNKVLDSIPGLKGHLGLA
jgi:hypothetical protein